MFRSTKGASKARRDLINSEIIVLRDLLPFPESARQRLSHLQIMSLAICYLRKCNSFQKLFGQASTSIFTGPALDFTKAISGFLLAVTAKGKLMYLSENVTDYLGHSMVDLMTQGDSLYDIIHPRDHDEVQNTFTAAVSSPDARVSFFCRMNVARSLKRQGTYGDHKVMYVKGHFTKGVYGDLFGSEPVFIAVVTPLVTPDTKDSVVQNCADVFQTVHNLDMTFIEVSDNAVYHTGFTEQDLRGSSWYHCVHPDDIMDAREKHTKVLQTLHEGGGCMLTMRLLTQAGGWLWTSCVIRYKRSSDGDDRLIVCTYQAIDQSEVEQFKQQSVYYSAHVAMSPEFLGQALVTSNSDFPADNSWAYGGLQSPTGSDRPNRGFFETGFSEMQNPVDRKRSAVPTFSVPPHGGQTWRTEEKDVLESGHESRANVLRILKRKLDTKECVPKKRKASPALVDPESVVNIQELLTGALSPPLLSALEQSLSSLSASQTGSTGGGVIVSSNAYPQPSYAYLKKHLDLTVRQPEAVMVPDMFSPGPLTPESIGSAFDCSAKYPGVTHVIIPKAMLSFDCFSPVSSVGSEQCVPSVVLDWDDDSLPESKSPPRNTVHSSVPQPFSPAQGVTSTPQQQQPDGHSEQPVIHSYKVHGMLPDFLGLDPRHVEEFFRQQSIENAVHNGMSQEHAVFPEDDLLEKSLLDLVAGDERVNELLVQLLSNTLLPDGVMNTSGQVDDIFVDNLLGQEVIDVDAEPVFGTDSFADLCGFPSTL